MSEQEYLYFEGEHHCGAMWYATTLKDGVARVICAKCGGLIEIPGEALRRAVEYVATLPGTGWDERTRMTVFRDSLVVTHPDNAPFIIPLDG